MSPRTVALALQDHHKVIIAASGILGTLVFVLQSFAWGFTTPSDRFGQMDQKVAAVAARVDTVKALYIEINTGLGALLIDRCLDSDRSPADLARMRLNCRKLLSQE